LEPDKKDYESSLSNLSAFRLALPDIPVLSKKLFKLALISGESLLARFRSPIN